MNRFATVLDKCPNCGGERYVQPSRTGRVCKACCNRAKSNAYHAKVHTHVLPLVDWEMPCRGCGEPTIARAKKPPAKGILCRSCCGRLAQATQALFDRKRERCTILDCNNFIQGKGLCPKHYAADRFKRKKEREAKEQESFQNMHSSAYMAGIVDGEGSICVFPYYGSYYKHHPYLRYRPSLSVANTNLTLMEWIVEHFGGSFTAVKRNRDVVDPGRWKQCYHWQVAHQQAAGIIRTILPFLVAKKRQGELFLTFMETSDRCGVKGTQPDILAQRKTLAGQISKLNERGNKSALESERFYPPYAQSEEEPQSKIAVV